MRRILRPASIAQLLLTPEYFATISLSSISLAAPELIAFELERCQERLEAAWVAVAAELKRWTDCGAVAIPDTNYYEHAMRGESIREHDWRSVLKLPPFDRVTLVVPMAVVDELDRHKRSKDKHLRTRSRLILREIDQLFRLGFNVDLTQESLTQDRIRIAALVDEGDQLAGDAGVLESALDVAQRCGSQPVILTGDTGMDLRARTYGLRVLKVPTPRPEDP